MLDLDHMKAGRGTWDPCAPATRISAFRRDLFAVSGGALYELVQDPETRAWEVIRTDLAR
jgi:hypothetical protein